MDFSAIHRAVEALRHGRCILVADCPERENEADLVIAAEKATPQIIAFMVRHTGGVLTVPMTSERLEQLKLPQMVTHNTEINRTAFTVSVDYRIGTTTGISAQDRTKTILALCDPNAKPEDFARPGHVFPLCYREGGVLQRAGHTEASVDLCQMANLLPVAVISELVNDDGSMPHDGDMRAFAQNYNIPLVFISDLIRYRQSREKLIKRVSQARIPTAHGDFDAYVFESLLNGVQHIALVKGNVQESDNVLVRIHSECLTGDVFGSFRCDCGPQLQSAMKLIAEAGQGVIVYLRGHEGRGIGLGSKLKAYSLQEQGRDTVQANEDLGLPVDTREYSIGAQILDDLGVGTVRLLTNNPAKYSGMEGFEVKIVDRVPIPVAANPHNLQYLRTKRDKMGHFISLNDS